MSDKEKKSIALPSIKSEVKKELWQYNWIIYGQPKVGKTTFLADFNNPLFICTEDRHKHLSIFKVPEKGALKSWVEIKEALTVVRKSIEKGDFKFKTIVVDTIDNAYKFCTDYICAKHNIEHEGDLGFGKGYGFIRNEFFNVFSYLCSLGVAVVFISHAEDKTLNDKVVEYVKKMPTLPNTGKKVLGPLVDIIGYIGFNPEKEKRDQRLLYLQGSETLEAGCATGVVMPAVMPLDFKLIEAEWKKNNKGEK
tara:strand:+ start:423 stop:1175 length:753 start_codon:yes stop_codon:yes gene_type:complete